MVGNWRKQPQPQQMEGTCQAQGVGWAGETSPLAFCRPRLLCRSTSAHKRGWASLMLTEPGNGWTERTMRPTSSKRALAARALLPPGALAPAGSGSQPLIPGVPPPTSPGCPQTVPAGCGPLPAGTGSQTSRTTGMGTGWAGARTARTSKSMTASGTTTPARGSSAGCARPAWAGPASAAGWGGASCRPPRRRCREREGSSLRPSPGGGERTKPVEVGPPQCCATTMFFSLAFKRLSRVPQGFAFLTRCIEVS